MEIITVLIWDLGLMSQQKMKGTQLFKIHHTTVSTPALGHRHLRCYNRRRYKRQVKSSQVKSTTLLSQYREIKRVKRLQRQKA